MPPATVTYYECAQASCRFRFPLYEGEKWYGVCPRCGGPVLAIHHLQLSGEPSREVHSPGTKLPVVAVLDNVRSAFNVGSIFRTADGAGLQGLVLCGITPTPEHPKVARTALGAEKTVPWRYSPNAVEAVTELSKTGYRLWAIERTPTAESVFQAPLFFPQSLVALVAGNEISGIDPDVLALCEHTYFIPQGGIKGSLNVAIALSIAVYQLRFRWETQ